MVVLGHLKSIKVSGKLRRAGHNAPKSAHNDRLAASGDGQTVNVVFPVYFGPTDVTNSSIASTARTDGRDPNHK
jgi:hypothetical protein